MTMDYDEEFELLALSARGRAEYKIRTIQQLGDGDIDPWCRPNLHKRAVRTRVGDRDYELVFGRGGDTTYVVTDTGAVETYTTGTDQWEYVEKTLLNRDGSPKRDNRGNELMFKGMEFSEKTTNVILVCDLWDPEIVGLANGRIRSDSLKAQILTSEGVRKNIRRMTLAQAQDAYLGANSAVRPLFRGEEMAFETEELSEGISQETSRLNHHMVSKLRLNRELAWLYRQGRETPTKRVPYPRAGCSPIGNLKSSDEVSWRDAEYRRAILLKRKGKRSLVRRQVHDLPHGLYYNKNEGEYEVMLGRLNLHGRRIIAHNRAERKSRRASEAYEQLMEALVDQAVRGRGSDRLTAWEILAKYGEDGLRTGSRMFYEAIFERPESSWIYPDDEARGRAYQRFTYNSLFEKMQAVLHAAYDVDPAITPVADYNPFWTTADHEKRYGDTWETVDPNNNHNVHKHKPWAKLVTDFIEANFDRSFPSEQYQFARMLSRIFGAHDKKSSRSKARAIRRLIELDIHVISPPTVSWVYEPDGKGGGEWKLHVDWSTFDYFAEGIEAVRDWVRMIGEWKFTKSARNSYDAMSFETRTADSLRGNDWGGIWNPVPYWACWSFWLEYLYADSRPSVLDEHGMPVFDANGNRKWYRRAPMPIIPADPHHGPPKRDPSETHEEWQVRVVAWNEKYYNDRPVRPAEPIRRAGESDEDWETRYVAWAKAWNTTIQAWEKERDQRWIKDVEAYSKAIDRRVVFMGWAWYDRDPDADMPHDGALRQLTAQKWADWLAMITQARGFNSLLGDGLVPDMTTFIKEQSSRVRNYRNETVWMESDEGAHHDPQAFWGYMGGLLRAHVVSMINYRLQAFRGSPDFFNILFKITDVKDESATTIRDQLTLMWENAPIKGLQARLLKIFDDARYENVIHIRPLYVRFLDGLPRKVVDRLEKFIRGLNRRSDRRVRAWAAHLSLGLTGGKRAFSMAQKFIDDQYGTNTGDRLTDDDGKLLTVGETEQLLQDNLGFFGWLNVQYDKAVPFVRGLVLREHSQLFVNPKENAEHVFKVIESGLWVNLAWEILEIASERGLFLKAKDFFPSRKKFDAEMKKTRIESHFEDKLKKYLGTDAFRAIVEGLLFQMMKEAKDPKRPVRVRVAAA